MIPLRTITVAFFVAAALGLCQSSKPPAFGVLAVIGDVSHDGVRILVELLVESPMNPVKQFAAGRSRPLEYFCACSVLKFQNLDTNSPETSINLRISNKPRVFEMKGLDSNARYTIFIENADDTANDCEECVYSVPAKEQPLAFRTFSPPHAAWKQDATLAILSCDRFIDDGDDDFWRVLLPNVLPIKPIDAVCHIGDQVYTDTLAALVLNSSVSIRSEELVEWFRDLYRYSWSRDTMAVVLRHGAHWMLPDDHDIINNADEHMLKHFVSGHSVFDITPSSTRQDKLAAVVLAAGIATLEYQIALNSAFGMQTDPVQFCSASGTECVSVTTQQDTWRDLSKRLSSRYPEALPPAWTFRTVNHVGIAMMDTRMDRVFSLETSQWISPRQLRAFEGQLDSWSKDGSVQEIIVIFGSPLLYLDGSLAELAVWWENERYSTLPSEANVTLATLELIWKYRGKISLIVGGDHHLHSHSLVCKDLYCIPQVISSGMTRFSQTIDSWHLFLFQFTNQHFTTPSVGQFQTLISGKSEDSTLGNNFLLVQSGDSDTLQDCGRTADPSGSHHEKCWWRLDIEGANTLHSRLFTPGTPENVASIQPWKHSPSGNIRYRSVFRTHKTTHLVILQAVFHHPVVAAGLLALGIVALSYCLSGVIAAAFFSAPPKPKAE